MTQGPDRRIDALRAEALASERDVLLASLGDLEREHAAGDVEDADYEELRAGYVARAAATLRAIDALRVDEDPPVAALSEGNQRRSGSARFQRLLGRRRSRVVLGVVGAVCALGLVGIGAAHLAGVRLPGEYVTGSVSLPGPAKVRQQLEQASVLGSTGKVAAAVALYGTVLAEAPDQPEALAYRGWLVRLAGIADGNASAVRAGDGELAKAVAVAPGYADGRALYGIALLEDDGQTRLALTQFRAFLGDRPGARLLELLGADMAAAFVSAHEPVPQALRPYERAARSASGGAGATGSGATGSGAAGSGAAGSGAAGSGSGTGGG